MKTISLSMIVKNEENHLRKALESVSGIDEIIVCDTGSKDNTVAIAKEYTNGVFTDYVWNDNFAEARNHSLSKCTSDWILIVDADEHLETPLEELYKAIDNAEDEGLIAINVKVVSEKTNQTHYQPRLFKRCDKNYWKNAIHNILSTVGQINSDIVIRYGYSDAHKLDPDRALRILKAEVEKDPSKTREKYYLAREYWYRKNYEQALFWYEDYLKTPTWIQERADAFLMAARCYFILQRGDKAREKCFEAIKLNPDFKEALLFMSELYHEPYKSKWKKIADNATNQDVLFIRT